MGNACLSKSGGVPGKCQKIENDLRSLAKGAGIESCADETVALMKCTSSAKADGCSAAFLAMRECNRAGGKQLVPEAGTYSIATGRGGLFNSATAKLVSSIVPARTL